MTSTCCIHRVEPRSGFTLVELVGAWGSEFDNYYLAAMLSPINSDPQGKAAATIVIPSARLAADARRPGIAGGRKDR